LEEFVGGVLPEEAEGGTVPGDE
jgi:hypothetical protein